MRKTLLGFAVSTALTLSLIPAMATPQFLNFPVASYGPFSSGIMATVLDHEVPHDLTQTTLPFGSATTLGPYGHSGGILSYTGELFLATGTYPNADDACYPKPSNTHQSSTWSTRLQGLYTGTSGSGANNCTVNNALNYDNHPGYDYLISSGTAVYPAYGGNIIFTKCILTFTNTGSCATDGAIAVDHGNGFVTQYLHMTNINYGLANSGSNQPVVGIGGVGAWHLGDVSDVGVSGHPHLHFEVLQRRSVTVDPNNYYSRKNYYVVDPYGYNTSSFYGDALLSKPGCLWVTTCLY